LFIFKLRESKDEEYELEEIELWKWNMKHRFKEKPQTVYPSDMTGDVAVAPGRSHLTIK
jgi:hypothetical protein